MQTVKIYGVQDRRSTVQAKLSCVVRYIIDGQHRSKSFRTGIEAERDRGLLLEAVQAAVSTKPAVNESWLLADTLADLRVQECATA